MSKKIDELTNYESGIPYVFSLLNGSEIISTIFNYTSEDPEYYILDKALQFVAQPKIGENGQQVGMSLGFTLASHFGEESTKGQIIRVPKSAIALIYRPNEQIEKMYSEQTSSLILPR